MTLINFVICDRNIFIIIENNNNKYAKYVRP